MNEIFIQKKILDKMELKGPCLTTAKLYQNLCTNFSLQSNKVNNSYTNNRFWGKVVLCFLKQMPSPHSITIAASVIHTVLRP